jgi:hypothetical protein
MINQLAICNRQLAWGLNFELCLLLIAYSLLRIAYFLNKGPPQKRQPDLHFMKQSGSYSRLLLLRTQGSR